MKVGIIPTKYGYSAVVLPPFKGDWELHAPVEIPEDMLVQLRGQILHELALYCTQLIPWSSTLFLSILWGTWSIAALALCNLWTLGARYTILYMWIRFFFFGDGLWSLGQTIRKLPQILKAGRIRREASKSEWTVYIDIPPHTTFPGSASTERSYIQSMMTAHPELVPYYNRMLRTEEPLVFSWYALGVTGMIKQLLLGPRIPEPNLIFHLGIIG